MANNPYVNKVQLANGTTLIDITDTTATAPDVASGKTFYLATGEQATGTSSGGSISITDEPNATGTTLVVTGDGGGGGGATQHSIYFEFSDGTDTTIPIYYDDSLIGTMITAYEPTTYSGKTVTLAQLDGVTWYTRPTETWETLMSGITNVNSDNPYNLIWLSDLSDVYPTFGEVYRITIDGYEYVCNVNPASPIGDANYYSVGNTKYSGGADNDVNAPFNFYNAGWGAWVGDTELPVSGINIKIERRVSA